MAPQPSLQINFLTPYRGGTHPWSTKFHFSGFTPSTDAEWLSVASAIWDPLKLYISERIQLQSFRGYVNDTSPAAYNLIDTTLANWPDDEGNPSPAYMASLLTWTTDQRNSRGGPIFCHNFLHGMSNQTTDVDALVSEQQVGLQAFAHDFSDAGGGFTASGHTIKRCTPNGAIGLEGICKAYLSHRVLARRG